MPCEMCLKPARLFRSLTKQKTCINCFLTQFENDIHTTITNNNMFQLNDRVAVCVSGGKDSTVLAHVLHRLNHKYNYGITLHLLSIDEGIKNYRDDSIKVVEKNKVDYGLPLHIVSYKELYGLTMDEVMVNQNNPKKHSCSFCGVFRRKALEKGAKKLNCNKMVLGHNADDLAETIILNFMRGDYEKLISCASNPVSVADNPPYIVKPLDISNNSSFSLIPRYKPLKYTYEKEIAKPLDISNNSSFSLIPRYKPLKYTYEKEIVLYAHYLNLNYFSTECKYAPQSTRTFARNYVKNLEKLNPVFIMNIIRYAESIQQKETLKMFQKCLVCSGMTSNETCKACLFVEQLGKN
ncbi:Cytoplasmic tRNA 2-thiolation protein 1 [Cucumispora dikerogammari]|nr:Cytoplasmic tRNA 2-thiolation protein 1 [Cucumispora dikerogammari]